MKSCSFFLVFTFKKGLAKFTIEVPHIYGFRQSDAFSVPRRVRLIHGCDPSIYGSHSFGDVYNNL